MLFLHRNGQEVTCCYQCFFVCKGNVLACDSLHCRMDSNHSTTAGRRMSVWGIAQAQKSPPCQTQFYIHIHRDGLPGPLPHFIPLQSAEDGSLTCSSTFHISSCMIPSTSIYHSALHHIGSVPMEPVEPKSAIFFI